MEDQRQGDRFGQEAHKFSRVTINDNRPINKLSQLMVGLNLEMLENLLQS